MDIPIKQITSLKSAEDLRDYLQDHRKLNLSLMVDKNGATLLHYASFKNDLVKLKLYFQHYKAYCEITHGNKMYEAGFQSKAKAWINQANYQGLTPVHFAALHGNIDILKMLEQLGANMEFKTQQLQNLLFMAVQNNQLKTLIYLIQQSKNKLDINDINNIGDNILHKAARSNCIAICAYLLTKRIDPNSQNQQGWTPLMEAVSANNKQIVKTMLLKGVDRHISNKQNKQAIDMARQDNRQGLVKILNDQFSLLERIKIGCNVQIVYRIQKPSYLYSIMFILIYNLVFLPTCIITEFTALPIQDAIYPVIIQGIYYAATIIIFILLLQKPVKKAPRQSLMEVEIPFCPECRNKKKNQFHCFTCGTCIYRYDHHCPWINNCVGVSNIGKFYAFLWLVEIGTFFVIFCHLCMIGLDEDIVQYRQFTAIEPQQKYISVICLLVALFFGSSISMLIIQQTKNLMTNTTQFQRSKLASKSSKSNSKQSGIETLLSEQNINKSSSISMRSQEEDEVVGCGSNCSNMLCSKK